MKWCASTWWSRTRALRGRSRVGGGRPELRQRAVGLNGFHTRRGPDKREQKERWAPPCLRLALLVLATLVGCVTSNYRPLEKTTGQDVTQLTENEFTVEYTVGAMTSQRQLDEFVRLRCAELTLQRGYDYFEMGERFDNLMFSRSTSVMVRLHKGTIPAGANLFHDARAVVAELSRLPKE